MTALYRFYDDRGQLLYIGISNRPRTRWQQHSVSKSWWSTVAHPTIQWLPSDVAEASEKLAIARERPLFNQIHSEGKVQARRTALGVELTMKAPTPVQVVETLSFTQAARRLVDEGIVPNMSREGLRQISRRDPEWPFRDEDLGQVGHARTMPWEPLAEFFRQRNALGARRSRGVDAKPRRRAGSA